MTTSTGPAVAVSAAPAAGTSARRFLMAVGGGVAILDQATKALVRATLALHDSVTVVPGLVDLTHVRNTGAAFGLLNAADFPFKPLVMLGIAVAAFLAIAVFALQLPPEDRLARTGLGLVLGGAVVGLVLVPDRLVAYLSLHVPPRTRDALVTLWAVVAFVALSRVFVLVQRGRRG